MKRVAFIDKKTFALIDHCAYPVDGDITPMAEYYGVIIEAPRPVPTVAEVQVELARLRVLHPDVVTKAAEGESVQYGKYSELGLCCEPFEYIGGAHG